MTTLTYFEPLIDGHCAFLARIVILGALCDARVTRIRLVADSALINRLRPLDPRIEVIALPEVSLTAMRATKLWLRGRTQWAEACRLSVEAGGVVFLPFFDHAAVAAALARGRGAGAGQISGIIFRPPNHYGRHVGFGSGLDAARRWATYVLANGPSIGRLFTFDEVAPFSCIGRLTGALHFLPDAAPDLTLFSASRPTPRLDGRAVALLFGALTARKGLFEIVEAWAQQSEEWLSTRVLRLVGVLDDPDKQILVSKITDLLSAKPSALIELEDRFVDETTLAQEVCSADLILAPYQNHVGSSGVVFWASAARKPLITQDTGLIGFQARKYHLGQTTDCTDIKSLSRALTEPWEPPPANLFLLRRHSLENVQQTLLDGILLGSGC